MYALILAGGKGERLRPLTDTTPKPMVRVNGEPILMHQVRWLRAAGITDVVFLVGYLGQMIEEYFGDGDRFDINARYVYEQTPLGRGGALKQGLATLPSTPGPVVATNGDVITDAEVGELIDDYQARSAGNPAHMATILTVPMVSPYGIVDSDGAGVVREFREKAELPYAINGGVYLLNPAIADLLPDVGDHEVGAFPELAAAGNLSSVHSRKFWRSVDSFKDLNEVETHLSRSLAAAGQRPS